MSEHTRKILVVCAQSSAQLLSVLQNRGWSVSVATSGQGAVSMARRNRFDLIVLVSTESDMDLTETLFNLRDFQETAPMVLLAFNQDQHQFDSTELASLARTSVVPISEFSDYLENLSSKEAIR